MSLNAPHLCCCKISYGSCKFQANPTQPKAMKVRAAALTDRHAMTCLLYITYTPSSQPSSGVWIKLQCAHVHCSAWTSCTVHTSTS